ncbi:uncharacterized protein LJ264_010913 isoform 2-T2 [Porphyrio hochstetteri]
MSGAGTEEEAEEETRPPSPPPRPEPGRRAQQSRGRSRTAGASPSPTRPAPGGVRPASESAGECRRGNRVRWRRCSGSSSGKPGAGTDGGERPWR